MRLSLQRARAPGRVCVRVCARACVCVRVPVRLTLGTMFNILTYAIRIDALSILRAAK